MRFSNTLRFGWPEFTGSFLVYFFFLILVAIWWGWWILSNGYLVEFGCFMIWNVRNGNVQCSWLAVGGSFIFWRKKKRIFSITSLILRQCGEIGEVFSNGYLKSRCFMIWNLRTCDALQLDWMNILVLVIILLLLQLQWWCGEIGECFFLFFFKWLPEIQVLLWSETWVIMFPNWIRWIYCFFFFFIVLTLLCCSDDALRLVNFVKWVSEIQVLCDLEVWIP